VKRIEGEVRKEIIDYGKALYNRRLVTGMSGNISGRIDDEAMIITPSGYCKGHLKPFNLVRMLIESGKVTAGSNPSMETPFHLSFYRTRKDIGGVVHAHPLYCTLLACSGRTVRTDYTPEGLIYLGRVAFVPYATPGSKELAENLRAAMPGGNTFIMENHGAIAVGKDVAEAYYRLETLEFLAEMQVRAEGPGNIKGLKEEEVRKILGMAEGGGR
jgi:L-fuculose-phosphate aldolase